MPRVSCIVSAYNEAERIGAVLAAVSGHPLVSEIIVVDDGSTDGTSAVAARYPGVRVVRHEKNLGKTAAIVSGLAETRGEILFFLDADLIGVTPGDISRLIEPVMSGAVDMTMTLRKNSLLAYRIIGCDFVSGERVFKRSFLAGHEAALAALPPFGFEVYTNRLAIEKKLRVRIVRWQSAVTPPKTAKRGLIPGVRADLAMVRDIFGVITPLELLQQNYFLAGFR